MIKSKYNVIGVMSGTSLDGIDLVFAEFEFREGWRFNILFSETVAYNQDWQTKLKKLVSYKLEMLKEIDRAYTKYLAGVIKDFMRKHNIERLDAVCSHGHTALHQPEKGLTYQIGNMPLLAKLLNEMVVCDFRVQDVALGGQGAPLVPIGDKLLFSEYDFCLNLGGFANLSTEINGIRVAYDVCSVNIVLNHYVRTLGLNYDDEGQIASQGTINIELLNQLNALPFYKEKYPKSLGLEWVEKTVFPLIDSYALEVEDVLKTVVEHIVIQLAAELQRKKNDSVLITGGGVYNTYLIERLKTKTTCEIVIPSESIIEFKEALIFALLGILKLRNENNCLQSVTGASKDHSSGNIFLP